VLHSTFPPCRRSPADAPAARRALSKELLAWTRHWNARRTDVLYVQDCGGGNSVGNWNTLYLVNLGGGGVSAPGAKYSQTLWDLAVNCRTAVNNSYYYNSVIMYRKNNLAEPTARNEKFASTASTNCRRYRSITQATVRAARKVAICQTEITTRTPMLCDFQESAKPLLSAVRCHLWRDVLSTFHGTSIVSESGGRREVQSRRIISLLFKCDVIWCNYLWLVTFKFARRLIKYMTNEMLVLFLRGLAYSSSVFCIQQ
jgi:hypothetical protein